MGRGERTERRENKDKANTDLQNGVLLLLLELVGTENLNTTSCLLVIETGVGALEELEDVVDVDFLNVALVLVIEVLSLEFDLGHVDRGICGGDASEKGAKKAKDERANVRCCFSSWPNSLYSRFLGASTSLPGVEAAGVSSTRGPGSFSTLGADIGVAGGVLRT